MTFFSSYEVSGPIIICGDFNVDVQSSQPQNPRSRLLNDLLEHHSLYIVSQSSISNGPNYTFFRDSCHSTIDYIIASSAIAGYTLNCFVHPHHPLNLSDHLPISISLDCTTLPVTATFPDSQHVNWARAVELNHISLYSDAVSLAIQPLLSAVDQSADGIDKEIIYVCELLSTLAVSYLPLSSKIKNHKNRFTNPELRDLCRTSKLAWHRWNANGRPLSGQLYIDKKAANKNVRQCVNRLRASSIRRSIQKRDQLFKNNDHNRFKFPTKSSHFTKIIAEDKITSDFSKICTTFGNYFSSLAASHTDPNIDDDTINSLRLNSFNNDNNILHGKISIQEISTAIQRLKSGKAAGPDNITAEHIKYGGHILIKWLYKIFNRILSLEEIPSCLKLGTITPIYKSKGKDPLLVESYRGITISSVLSKLLESIILKRLDHTLDNLNIPHCLQTAYRKGLSCSDAVFATQEALLTHLREGGHPYLCLFDLEKAFDSIELSILLKRLFAIGVNGKCWRIVLSWYSSALSRIRVGSKLSEPFSITRGVKQGSVLSPILFLIVIDPLLLTLKDRYAGLSIHGSFVGAAAHADNLRTIAPSIAPVIEQAAIIDDFTTGSHLNLNSDKTEIVKISRCRPAPDEIVLFDSTITITMEAKCLGVWWNYNLSALRSVQENITKARKAFFAFGRIEAFQGHLNPLSAISIFESCVILILLYGCDTWLLSSTTLLLLDQFQNEIGRRILKLQKNASGKVTRLCLNFKSMACCILLRKLSFLGKLLESRQRTISSAIFTSATISDPSEVSIVQQCKMLESRLSVQIVDDCLSHPDAAPAIVRSEKSTIIDADMGSLIISALHHPSACHIATNATKISWNYLWNLALDRGTNSTSQLQRIVHHLSRPTFPGFVCSLCQLPVDTSWITHICTSHDVTLDSLSLSPDATTDLMCCEDDNIFRIKFPK